TAYGAFEHAPVDLAEVRMMKQRVVKRVHRRKDVHLVVAEFLDQSANVAGIYEQKGRSPRPYAEEKASRQCEDVIERQCRDYKKLVGLRRQIDHRLIPGFHLQHVGDQIAMQQHGAFGDASRTAGILQECNIVWTNRGFYETGFVARRERGIVSYPFCRGR